MARTIKANGDAANDTGRFKNYPVGEYIGEIIDVERTKFAKTGDNKNMDAMNVKVRFTEAGPGEQYVGKKFVAFRVPDEPEFASGAAAYRFYQFYKAVGVPFPGKGEEFDVELPEHEDLLGEEIGIELGLEDTNKEDPDNPGEFLKRNAVVRFFPASDGVKDTSGAGDGTDPDEFSL